MLKILILLVIFSLALNQINSYFIIPRTIPAVERIDDELLLEDSPVVDIADEEPVVKKHEEIVDVEAEAKPKIGDAKEVTEEPIKSTTAKHTPGLLTPIPHTGNVDNANLLEYSAHNLNGNGKNNQPRKHTGKVDDNCIDYDYLNISADVFRQNLFGQG